MKTKSFSAKGRMAFVVELARTELGYHQVQGLDYAYTIHGWLKGVNGTTTNPYRDMGKDGNVNYTGNDNDSFARDVYGFTLSYYQGDYTAANYIDENQRFEAKLASSAVDASAPSLYNGNIRIMTVSISQFGNTPMAYAYQYDQLNRLMSMNAWNNYDSTYNKWSTTGTEINAYHNRFTYDANGNILTQIRRGSSASLALDSLEYTYYSGTNRLKYVSDGVSSGAFSDDIDNQTDTNNYKYDAIGNLVYDKAEEIDTISWNVYGKITKIKRNTASTKPDLEFQYTPDGHRVLKVVIPKLSGQHKTYTYYVRDAQGNVMATYERIFSKVIDYDSIIYSSINDTLKKVTGLNAFGSFISNTYATSSALTDSLYNAAIDSTKAVNILDHFNLTDYLNSDLSTNTDALVDGYDITNLKDAIFSNLNNTSQLQAFLESMCNNSNDITDDVIQNYMSDYLQTLYNTDPTQYQNMDFALSSNSWVDFSTSVTWLVANSSAAAIRSWLNSNWPGFTSCNTSMGILMGISPMATLEDAVKTAWSNNASGFRAEVKSYFDDSYLINELYNYNFSHFQTNTLATFDHATMLAWYRDNMTSGFMGYAAEELHTRPAVWQQAHAPHSMEQYFGYIKSYFGQVTYDNILLKYYNVSRAYHDSFNLAEWHIYGSSRLGIYSTNLNLVTVKFYGDTSGASFSNADTVSYSYAVANYSLFYLQRGCKQYELTNHLGNVLVVISDKKIPYCTSDTVRYRLADIISATDYSPFGASLPQRSFAGGAYRYGFNGQEKDDEVAGAGNMYAFEYRIHDARLGRFLSIDPLTQDFPWNSPYNFAECSPIAYIDYLGLSKQTRYVGEDGKLLADTKDGNNSTITVKKNQRAAFDKWLKDSKSKGTLDNADNNMDIIHQLTPNTQGVYFTSSSYGMKYMDKFSALDKKEYSGYLLKDGFYVDATKGFARNLNKQYENEYDQSGVYANVNKGKL